MPSIPQARHAPTTDPDPVAETPDQAIDEFVRRHQTGLWRFARLLGGDGLTAQELAQEALLLAIDRGLVTAPDRQATAFLRQATKNLWLHRRRDDHRRAARHAEAAEAIWLRELASDDGAGWLEALDQCLAQLPPRARQALDLAYRDNLDRASIGTALGIGPHGARTLLQRTRATLRTCIERRRQR